MRIREDATTMIAIRRLLRSEFSSLDRSFVRDALSELPLSVARPCETFFEIGDERNTTAFHFLTIATENDGIARSTWMEKIQVLEKRDNKSRGRKKRKDGNEVSLAVESMSRNEAAWPRNEELVFHLWLKERVLRFSIPFQVRAILLGVHAAMRSRTLTSRERKLLQPVRWWPWPPPLI